VFVNEWDLFLKVAKRLEIVLFIWLETNINFWLETNINFWLETNINFFFGWYRRWIMRISVANCAIRVVTLSRNLSSDPMGLPSGFECPDVSVVESLLREQLHQSL
jgi:hypothetical protein